MAVLEEGALRDVEPTKLVLNIFDAPEKLEIVGIGNSCSPNGIHQLTCVMPPISHPCFYPFTNSELKGNTKLKETCLSVYSEAAELNLSDGHIM